MFMASTFLIKIDENSLNTRKGVPELRCPALVCLSALEKKLA